MTAVYAALVAGLLLYGLHCHLLVLLHWLGRRRDPGPPPVPGWTPRVVVQVPVYNERFVVGRLLDALAALDWPAERLEVQVLDDSTDDTPEEVARHLGALAERGVAVSHLRRADRQGYKAGALAYGLSRTDAEVVAVLDADFVPPPGLLRGLAPWLGPGVAAVQARWTHLNREESLLTRAVARSIDAHFLVEQAARGRFGLLTNFCGSAGIWRREAIEAAGGWSAETVTEDLDLSYRVQRLGWRIVHREDVCCPAEVPSTLAAYKAQQRRWARGSAQTARRNLLPVLRSGRPLLHRLEAFFHLTRYGVHPLLVGSALAVWPLLLAHAPAGHPTLAAAVPPLLLATLGPSALHLYTARRSGLPLTPPEWAALFLLGIGVAVSDSLAFLGGLCGAGGHFARTPKTGGAPASAAALYRVRERLGMPALEVGVAAACAAAAILLGGAGAFWVAPFLALYAASFLWVGALSAWEAVAP